MAETTIQKVEVEFEDLHELLKQAGCKSLEGRKIGWYEAQLHKFNGKQLGFTSDFQVTDENGEPDARLKGVLINVLAALEDADAGKCDVDFEVLNFPELPKASSKPNGKPKKEKTPKEPKPEPEPPKMLTEEEKQAIRDRYKREPGSDPDFEWYPEFTVEKADELLEANFANRPCRKAINQRYAEMFLTKSWGRTLEPIVFDWNGEMGSGQHRCYGLKLAEEIRLSDPELYKLKYEWDGPVTAPMVVAFGADPEAIDFLDRGQQRTGGDVLFRRNEFDEEQYSENDLKRLSSDLAKAAKLCWVETGEKAVSDAPHFPHSEMIEFVQGNPVLKEMVEFVYKTDGGRDRKISKWVNRGAMAGLAYLFAASNTQTDKNGVYEELDFSNREKAEQFVEELASGTTDNENAPIHQFREWVTRQLTKMGTAQRGPRIEVKLYMLVKVWKAYISGEEMEAKAFRVPKKGPVIKIGGIA